MTTTEEKIEKINKEMARILKAVPNVILPNSKQEEDDFSENPETSG